MCRSWGFYQAWRDENDYILSLDDDVLPSNTDIFKAYEYEFTRENLLSEYLNVGSLNSAEYPMRGVPYGGRWQEVVVQYGGWIGVPDLDAVTQLQDFSQHRNSIPARVILPVPKGIPMTTCAMNFAFKSEYTPLMWQLPLYEGRYNRFGDIWSGLIQKRVLDKMNKVMLLNQRANVIHKRASDPFTNLKREAPGMHLNESMWEKTDLLRGAIFEDPIIGAFKLSTLSMAYSIGAIDPEYRDHFIDARDKWLALFS